MEVISLRTVLILTFLVVWFGGSHAWFSRRRHRRRCASHSCTWHWGSCNRTCGGGTQSPIKTVNQGACGSCNLPSTKSCNTQCCRVDCLLTTWTSWTECSHTCGAKGSQNRHRNITQESFCGGKPCEPNHFETRVCNPFCFNNGSLGTDACLCPVGWKGNCCQEDVNECGTGLDNCNDETQLCRNQDGGFLCMCKDGYEMKDGKCKDLDECKIGSDDCNEKTQLCQNQNGGFLCVCKNGYEMQNGECKELVSDDDHGKKTPKPADIASIVLIVVFLLVAATILVIKLYRRSWANAGQYRVFVDYISRRSST